MIDRVQEKRQAIALRKRGYSYKDILKEVKVSKSSLSLWLKDLPLTAKERHYLKKRVDSNISRGKIRAATSLHQRRVERDNELFEISRQEFRKWQDQSFFQVGIGLYWAEGAKRNQYFSFSNSDSDMVRVMIRWMETYLGISRTEIHACLFIHKPFAHENCEGFWANRTGIPPVQFTKTVYKPTGKLVKKRPQYKGVLRIYTNTVHLRKLKFWMQMLADLYNTV